MRNRIVITGMGCITPIGHDISTFWSNCIRGQKGFGGITHFDNTKVKTSLVAEVKDFDPSRVFGRKLSRRLDRYAQFAIHAGRQAIENSKLFDTDKVHKSRVGVVLGTGVGGVSTFEGEHEKLKEQGSTYVNPLLMPKWIPNMAAANVAMDLEICGPVHIVSTACASGIDAIGHAILLIESGRVDAVLAGGAEACITPTMIAGFENMGALSPERDVCKASIPFDMNRNGFILGEGAAVLVIETLESAIQRGGHVIAEIVGYGSSCDAYHLTAPHPEAQGGIKAIEEAMNEAGIRKDDVDYFNAHGTSTIQNDGVESACINRVFGKYSDQVHINSTKSLVGHMQGAAGALETIVCALTLQTGIIHPTAGTENIDPNCTINLVVDKALNKTCNYALNNALGFGGHNAALVLKKYV